jgi:acetylornithine deacetylase/succinyl-diaminopimelate desuccinylase-like protein
MERPKIGFVVLAASAAIIGLAAPGNGAGRDSVLTVVGREYAVSNPVLVDCPAHEMADNRLLVMVPGSLAGRLPMLEAAVPSGAIENPLWVTPAEVPPEVARRAGVEVVFRDRVNTVFVASEDAAYDLMAQGYFIVKVELLPLRQTVPPVWGRLMTKQILERRPLDTARIGFIRTVSDSVDTLRLKDILHFLEYDDANDRFRSRFQVRPEVRQEVVPYMIDMLSSCVGPHGGFVEEQQFVKKLGGAFACTDTIPCDTIFTNVIATKPGRRTSAHYVICAHYDAIATRTPGWSDQWYMEDVPAPGADDNGTGVAVVLECARLLGPLDLDVGVKFMAFSGEELGLLGSDYYVDQLEPEDSVIAVINVDMVGYVDEAPLVEIVYNWKSKWLSDQLEDVARVLELESGIEPVNLSGIGRSDHASFWKVGIPGTELSEELEDIGEGKGSPVNPHYHSVEDTVGNLDIGLVRDAARLVVGLVSRFAEMPGDSLSDLVLTEGSVEWDWEGHDIHRPPVAGDSLSVRVRALNVGLAMEQPEAYAFEIWQGGRATGMLIHESAPTLQMVRGAHTDLEYSWQCRPDRYGDVKFTFVLLPAREDLESDVANNSVETMLEIMPSAPVLRHPHMAPNPVSFGETEPRLMFEILHPEGDFNAVMNVWLFDILGAVVGRGRFEKTPVVRDFDIGQNSIALSRFVTEDLAPGLYVCRMRLRLLGEPGVFEAKFKFAVDR